MPKPMIDRRQHREQCRRGELTQRRRGADVDDGAVVGLLLTVHDLAVGELVAHLLHDDTGGATDRTDGEREKRNAIEPPMSRPMNVFGSATLIA